MADARRQGGCLCGAVRFSAIPKKPEYGACHCSICRKWSGGPWLAVDCGGSVVVEQGAKMGAYSSSEWAERRFCTSCGTALFYKLKDQDFFVVSLEAFDDAQGFTFTEEVCIDEKPASYAFANHTRKMTGAEMFEAFAEAQEDKADRSGKSDG